MRGHHTAKQFGRLGVPCAIIAANERWTTFALLDDIDTASVAAVLEAVVMRIDADDDHGSSVSFFVPDGWSAELVVELAPDDPKLTTADRELFEELIARGVLTASQSQHLRKQLQRLKDRSSWLENDGLEKAFGVPNTIPLWTPVTREVLAGSGLDPEFVTPTERASDKRASDKRASRPAIKAPPADAATRHEPVDPRVLAVHVYYWRHVFQMNGWVLYQRYKKHLPAARRRDVDQLVDLSVRGAEPGELERAVEHILSTVWSSDDWIAAIGDRRLSADEPLSEEQLVEWQHQLESLPSVET